MTYKTNPAFGDAPEMDAFQRLIKNKIDLLRQICDQDFKVLRETLEEYAQVDGTANDHTKIPPKISLTEIRLVQARRRRYHDFLRRESSLSSSNGDYTQAKSAFLDYCSLNLPWACLNQACDRYLQYHQVTPHTLQIIQQRDEVRKLSAALLEHHSGLVHRIFMMMYSSLGPNLQTLGDEEGMLQEGKIGLLTAIDRYDPQRQARFSTYAHLWVWQSMKRYVSQQKKEVDQHISLSAPLQQGADLTLEDQLKDENTPTPEEHALSTAAGKSLDQLLPSTIEPRDRQVIEYLFGFYDGKEHSREETGKRFGVSASRIGQIYVESIKKIRKHLDYKEMVSGYLSPKRE